MQLRIGTRSSPMALAQARLVASLLPRLPYEPTIVPLSTSGDRWGGSLAELGGKGAFVKELDRAQLDGEVDLVVHCLKDVPGDVPLPEGLTIAAYLPRDDVHDCVVGARLADLPDGARIGTSSVRRAAQLRRSHPQLNPLPIRGSANSRLAKLDAGEFDALILAVAGLERIGESLRIAQILTTTQMLPAVGAGVLALQCRTDDERTLATATALDDAPTRACVTAERALLRELRGHCHSPIAAYCTGTGAGLTLHAAVYSPDGADVLQATDHGSEPDKLGATVAGELLARGARALIDAIPR
ncbi:hydroxymethylbilane synthase [Embleya sp. NBC_00896]|uniref:hydroxymethylbilane synthase n=1 Tax=Embleya sp. NBC_00896 TaxID=2975961 RepID=UPI003870D084|nr:hydroxymethylbilane synthase [Embleya sp. NBC_00896]